VKGKPGNHSPPPFKAETGKEKAQTKIGFKNDTEMNLLVKNTWLDYI